MAGGKEVPAGKYIPGHILQQAHCPGRRLLLVRRTDQPEGQLEAVAAVFRVIGLLFIQFREPEGDKMPMGIGQLRFIGADPVQRVLASQHVGQ
ncbi:hypothetical protein D3C75_1133840 [compost metagenome]